MKLPADILDEKLYIPLGEWFTLHLVMKDKQEIQTMVRLDHVKNPCAKRKKREKTLMVRGKAERGGAIFFYSNRFSHSH